MQNRLDQPPPEEELARIRELAYDLAYGRTVGMWGPRFDVEVNRATGDIERIFFYDNGQGGKAFEGYLNRKWGNEPPAFELLSDHGFLRGGARTTTSDEWDITPHTFGLLWDAERVNTAVFISYKRETSSAFALLIESRLQNLGINAFVDRSIVGGDDWHGELEHRVKTSPVFICVIAPGTLASEWVQKEIEWAQDNLRIAVLHHGYQYESDEMRGGYPQSVADFLERQHWVEVKDEIAKDYHNAIEDIINAIRLRAG